MRGSAGIGRQARLRCVCAGVWVQVPSAAPKGLPPLAGGISFGFKGRDWKERSALRRERGTIEVKNLVRKTRKTAAKIPKILALWADP